MTLKDIVFARYGRGTLMEQLLARKLMGGGGTLIGTDTDPYLFRRSPSLGAYKTERDEIVGVSVGFNQLADTFAAYGSKGTAVKDGNKYTYTFTDLGNNQYENSIRSTNQFNSISGHKYLEFFDVFCTKAFRASIGTMTDDWAYRDVTANVKEQKSVIVNGNGATPYLYIGVSMANANTFVVGDTFEISNIQCFDLTQMLGSTIADYIYSLEQGTAGAGVAFFKRYFGDDYYPFDSGSIRSVEGLVSHTMKDENDNIIGEYPLDSTVTLRGLFKLEDGKLKADGDTYKANGTITRNWGERAYQSGDESLADAITDGTTTVYKLTTPTTEQAQPYAKNQKVSPSGTEEYVSTGVVPVGHNTEYYG